MAENEKRNNLGILGKSKALRCVVVIFGVLLDIFLVRNFLSKISILFGFNFYMLFNFTLHYGFFIVLAMYLNYNIGVIVSRYVNKIILKPKNNEQNMRKKVVLFDVIFCLLSSIAISIIFTVLVMITYDGGCDYDGCFTPSVSLTFLCSFLTMIILNITTFIGVLKGYQKIMMEDKGKVELGNTINTTMEPNGAKLEETMPCETIEQYKPKTWQYLLGVFGFILSVFTVISTFDFTWILVVALVMTGGIIGIIALNYSTGCLISYYAQKLMRKISFDERYEVLFMILVDILYQLICVLISVGFLLLKNGGGGGQIRVCADACWNEDIGFVFLMSFIMVIILNITTFVASINKLASYQAKKKLRNKK